MIFVVQKYYIIPLIHLFWPNISSKKLVLESFKLTDFWSLLECTEQK